MDIDDDFADKHDGEELIASMISSMRLDHEHELPPSSSTQRGVDRQKNKQHQEVQRLKSLAAASHVFKPSGSALPRWRPNQAALNNKKQHKTQNGVLANTDDKLSVYGKRGWEKLQDLHLAQQALHLYRLRNMKETTALNGIPAQHVSSVPRSSSKPTAASVDEATSNSNLQFDTAAHPVSTNLQFDTAANNRPHKFRTFAQLRAKLGRRNIRIIQSLRVITSKKQRTAAPDITSDNFIATAHHVSTNLQIDTPASNMHGMLPRLRHGRSRIIQPDLILGASEEILAALKLSDEKKEASHPSSAPTERSFRDI